MIYYYFKYAKLVKLAKYLVVFPKSLGIKISEISEILQLVVPQIFPLCSNSKVC